MYRLKFIFKLIALLFALSWHSFIFAKDDPELPLKLLNTSEVRTEYFILSTREFSLPPEQFGRGGSILPMESSIIYGSTSGIFYKINTSNYNIEANYLPKLNTGADFLASSKRITFKELSPRVLDIIYEDGFYYVTYERYDPKDDVVRFVISKIKKSDRNWTDIYQSPKLDATYFAMGDGGKMAFKQGRLYFTVGDFSLDRINNLPSDVAPQNKNLPWGKINYIDIKDNSFHYYSLGHRNPKGLLFLKDGRLLSSENGPQGGDEINLIQQGKNYGWPYESYGTLYGTGFGRYKDALPPVKNERYKSSILIKFGLISPKQSVYETPIFAFIPSISPTALVQIKDFDINWDDDLLLGSLRAMSLFHIKLIDDRVVYSEPILLGKRIRDLKQSYKKFILLTDDNSLIIVEKK